MFCDERECGIAAAFGGEQGSFFKPDCRPGIRPQSSNRVVFPNSRVAFQPRLRQSAYRFSVGIKLEAAVL